MEPGRSQVEGLVRPSSLFWQGKSVLLTGHTGFKGSWMSLWLRHLGADVHGLALPPASHVGGEPLWSALGTPGGGERSLGDIRDPAAVLAAYERARPEIVIHMAAQALVHPSYDDPVTTFDTNVMGLVRVLEGARASPTVRAIVNVTSDKCYENKEQLWPYREDEPMGGSDPYSASKGCSELVTESYRQSFFRKGGARLASARAGNVIGGGDWSADRLIPDCVRAFGAGQPVRIRNPLATRPWQHVLEPLCGYLSLAEHLFEEDGARFAEGWNFGPADAEAWPVGRVVDAVTANWAEGSSWDLDDRAHPHEAMLLRVDSSKARFHLKWAPRLATEEALRWSCAWYKDVGSGRSALEITQQQIEAYEALAGGGE